MGALSVFLAVFWTLGSVVRALDCADLRVMNAFTPGQEGQEVRRYKARFPLWDVKGASMLIHQRGLLWLWL